MFDRRLALTPTLKLRSAEVLENLLPVWRIVVTTQVWLELSTQNLQSRALADSIRAYETQDLTRPRRGQPVYFEAIGRVSMSDLSLEVGGQVDDVDRRERTLLWADAASDAEAFRYEGNLRLRGHLDAKLPTANNRA